MGPASGSRGGRRRPERPVPPPTPCSSGRDAGTRTREEGDPAGSGRARSRGGSRGFVGGPEPARGSGIGERHLRSVPPTRPPRPGSPSRRPRRRGGERRGGRWPAHQPTPQIKGVPQVGVGAPHGQCPVFVNGVRRDGPEYQTGHGHDATGKEGRLRGVGEEEKGGGKEPGQLQSLTPVGEPQETGPTGVSPRSGLVRERFPHPCLPRLQ